MDTGKICYYIFDLYGTLVDIHTDETKRDVWEKMSLWFREHGAEYDPDTLKKCYHREVRRQNRALHVILPSAGYPEIRLEGVFYYLFYNRGIAPSEEMIREAGWEFRKASTEKLCLYPGAVELLRMLRMQGKVLLLSNAQSLFTRPELEQLGICDSFDGIYISSEHLWKKPDEHFYRELLEREKIYPAEAVMIGNDETADIRGAKSVGLQAIYLNSNLSPVFHGSAADMVLDPSDLHELAEILKKETCPEPAPRVCGIIQEGKRV